MTDGINESERYLSSLAKAAFLDPWSYSNLFNQRGKELADFTVIFGDRVIVFSDKYCEFDHDIDQVVAWKRWYRSAVKKSVRQLRGAARLIRNGGERFYLDPKCTVPLPVPIPASPKITLIAVAKRSPLGLARVHSTNHIALTLVGKPYQEEEEVPFEIGQHFGADSFVHVIDEESLDVLLQEMDTIKDLTIYLDAKERLFAENKIGRCTDADLLSLHLRNFAVNQNEVLEELFKASEPQTIKPELWEVVRDHPRYLAKKAADHASYFWDEIVNLFFKGCADASSPLVEMMQWMAAESRFERRNLSTRYRDGLQSVPNGQCWKGLTVSNTSSTAYVFVVVPGDDWMSSEHLVRRMRLLRDVVMVVGCLSQEAKEADRIIGIAASKHPHTNFDGSLLRRSDIDDETVAYAMELQQLTGIWTHPTQRTQSTTMYPDFIVFTRH